MVINNVVLSNLYHTSLEEAIKDGLKRINPTVKEIQHPLNEYLKGVDILDMRKSLVNLRILEFKKTLN
jgi:hypothetical protein